MRGKDERSGNLFSYVDLETRVPQNHPLRAIRALTNATLAEMSEDFEALYAHTGRPGRPRPKKSDRLLVRLEHYLLAFPRIDLNQKHTAVAQPHMRRLDRGRRPGQDHQFMAPVELAGFPGVKD